MADPIGREGQQLGNYRLIRLLGQGSFAQVYLAEHIYLKTQAAIKVLQTQLTDNDMESFLAEARNIARLKHHNIVRVLEFGVEDGTPFLVTTYASNGSLRQHHPNGSHLPLTSIVPYVKQVAAALQYAHNQELLHRDVKPENMLLGRHNELLLSDFGTTLITQSLHYQEAGGMEGSVAYMAPEQLHGKPCPASDQYALGMVVYEWLSGDCAFHGSFIEIADQHLSVPPPPLREKTPTVSPDVEAVVMTTLAKEPQRRFASVTAFANALEQASGLDLAILLPSLSSSSSQPFPPDTQMHEATPSSLEQNPLVSLQSVPASPIPTVQQRSQQRRFLSIGVIALLIVLLIAGGSGLFYYITGSRSLHTQLIPPAQILLTAQARATGSANARADATFAAMTPQEIYTYATSGSPVINDSLSSSNSSTWKNSREAIGSCAFMSGVYHVHVAEQSQHLSCLSHGSILRNFALQVQMTIVKGDAGGIIFRADSENSRFYSIGILRETGINQEGGYQIVLNVDKTGQQLEGGFNPNIKVGLNQSNLIAVVAHENDFYLYVNKQYITRVSDNTLVSGTVGVFASNGTSASTDVAFHNAQVWQL